VKTKRLRWQGLLFRTNEIYPNRKSTFIKAEGAKRIGRLIAGWLDSIE
jgi:hypothetical protein